MIKGKDGKYTQAFKTQFVKFSQTAKSLSKASDGLRCILKALGIYDEQTKRCIPTRPTTTLWREIEAAVQVGAYVEKIKGNKIIGINCDGSERGDLNVLMVMAFGWSEQEQR